MCHGSGAILVMFFLLILCGVAAIHGYVQAAQVLQLLQILAWAASEQLDARRDADRALLKTQNRDRAGGDGRGPLLCRGSSRNSLGGGESSKQHGELLPSLGTRSIGTPVKKTTTVLFSRGPSPHYEQDQRFERSLGTTAGRWTHRDRHHRRQHHHHHWGAPNRIGSRRGTVGGRQLLAWTGRNSPCLQTWLSLRFCHQLLFDTPKLWTKGGSKTKSLIDHITDFQNNSVTQNFLQDEQPHRESQARQVDWCHGKSGARRLCAVSRHVAGPSWRVLVSTRC